MFFRMLKNDLKAKKGLNLIVFIFMIAAAALVFVGTVQLYAVITGSSYTDRMCKAYNSYFYVKEENEEKARGVMDQHPMVNDYTVSRACIINNTLINFDHYEELEDANFFNKRYLVVKQPREADLVYDIHDRPFYVKDGTVVLPRSIGEYAGASTGDKVRITTDYGNTYEFTIANFYKEVTNSRMRIILSDADYEVLSQEYLNHAVCLEVNAKDAEYETLTDITIALRENGVTASWFSRNGMSNDDMMLFILSVFVLVCSLFMILIIFMTIRFTMLSAIRDEEKEIGTMRAIGVDNLSFRWLFSAKYIGFAVFGGILGIVAGFFLSDAFLNTFSSNLLFPPSGVKLVVGIISVSALALIMILFCLLVMRKISKISVINAIHGEAGGERFGKSSYLFLHKRKKIGVPLFLSLSDILKGFKRYFFLVAGYAIGVSVLLLVFNIAGSVINVRFAKYFGINRMDFYLSFNRQMTREYDNRELQEGKDFWELINEDLEKNDIPAHAELYQYTIFKLIVDGQELEYDVRFESNENEKFQFTKGSRVPALANEVAITEYTAKQHGIGIGDVITVDMCEEDEEGNLIVVRKELVVTGFLLEAEMNTRSALMGSEYHDGYHAGHGWSSLVIDEGGEKNLDRIRDIYGEYYVLDEIEGILYFMSDYAGLFDIL
ncbi:MAG: ABC transporter permease, partial [Clostridiales bacterium]|nr:ABC transporter permease [Clostridiales bacterium]